MPLQPDSTEDLAQSMRVSGAAKAGLLDVSSCHSELVGILATECGALALATLALARPTHHLVLRATTQPIFKSAVIDSAHACHWITSKPILEKVNDLPPEVFDIDSLCQLGAEYVVITTIPNCEDASLNPMLPRLDSDIPLSELGVVVSAASSFAHASSCARKLATWGTFLSTILVTSIQSTEKQVRSEIVSRTLIKRDLNSVLYTILHTIRDTLPFEGGSIFLWDSRRQILQLHATTGLSVPHRRSDVFYRRGENRITLKVAETNLCSVTDNIGRDHLDRGKSEEVVASERVSFLAVPIPDLSRTSAAGTATPLGVLRLVNRISRCCESKPVPFAWDDQCIIRFAAEVVGVISNYVWRAKDAQDHFDRVIHGIKANIGAVVLNIGHLCKHPELIEFKHSGLKYVLPDCLALVRDLHWQVERNVDWYRNRFETEARGSDRGAEIKLLGGVLAKIKGVFSEMRSVQNAGIVSLDYSDYDGFTRLPAVIGAPEALHTVFRNLIENALKYTNDKAVEKKIELGYRLEGNYLEITVDDNGIGVPAGDEEWIFVDGYRADNAMRRRPGGGGGIGLPQSKQLMMDMGGDLYFERIPNITRFVVKLRLK